MQGTPAHLEYLRNKKPKRKIVNCRFWNDGICNNNISTKYGEECFSKSTCLYSIDQKQTVVKTMNIREYENMKPNHKSSSGEHRKIDYLNIFILKYFMHNIETRTRVYDKEYKVIASYNKKTDKLVEKLSINGENDKESVIYVILMLKKIISIRGKEIKFTISIEDILNGLNYDANYILRSYLKKKISLDIDRVCDINDRESIEKAIDDIIKYIGFIVIKGYIDSQKYSMNL